VSAAHFGRLVCCSSSPSAEKHDINDSDTVYTHPKSLTHLSLNNTGIGDLGFEAIIKWLENLQQRGRGLRSDTLDDDLSLKNIDLKAVSNQEHVLVSLNKVDVFVEQHSGDGPTSKIIHVCSFQNLVDLSQYLNQSTFFVVSRHLDIPFTVTFAPPPPPLDHDRAHASKRKSSRGLYRGCSLQACATASKRQSNEETWSESYNRCGSKLLDFGDAWAVCKRLYSR